MSFRSRWSKRDILGILVVVGILFAGSSIDWILQHGKAALATIAVVSGLFDKFGAEIALIIGALLFGVIMTWGENVLKTLRRIEQHLDEMNGRQNAPPD